MKNKKGFTFIETLIVIAIIAIMATAVVVAVNPARRFEDARDKQREIHLQTILNAVNQKRAVESRDCDNMPDGVDASTSLPIFETIGTDHYDLFKCLVPFYLDNALYDPDEGSKENTHYQIWQNPYTKRVTVRYVKDNKEIAAGPKEYWIFGVPVVETGEISTSTITHISAKVLNSEVKSEEGASVFERGVIWHTNPNPTYNDNIGRTVDGSGLGEFDSTITGLTSNTTYYVRAYAKNDIGVGYGEEEPRVSFSTPDLRPVVETLSPAENVTHETATLLGKILTLGESPVTAYFCWGESVPSGDDCPESQKKSVATNITKPSSFSADLGKDELIIGELESKDYYFKACGHNNSGDRCGGIVKFTIQKGKPYVKTLDPDDGYGEVSAKWARVEGQIKSDGGYPITKKGICFSNSGEGNPCNFDPDSSPNCKESEGELGDGIFHVTIPDSESGDPDLRPGNEYNICAYASNIKGLSYGGMESFQAKFTAPDVRITGVTPSHSSAEVWGTIDSDGGKTVPQKGICWRSSLAGDPKKLDPTQNTTNCTNDGSGRENQPFKSIISTGPDGLFGNTTYNVRAYAINGTGAMWIGWSDLVQFNPTLSISPKLTTYAVNPNDVDNKSALVKGRITDHGGAEINAIGFCWTTNLSHTTQTLIPDPKPADVDCGSLLIQNLINFGDFSYKATGLYAEREYKIQAYARNIRGYDYGGVQSFETKEAVKPQLAINPGTTIIGYGTDWVKIDGNLISNGGDNGTIIGVCYSSSTQYQNPAYPPDNVNVFCDTRVTNGEVGQFEFTINGLSTGVTYYALTFARNSAGTVYGIPSESFKVGKKLGETCTTSTQCYFGFCADGVCCNTACTGTCQVCNSQGSCTIRPAEDNVECGICQRCDNVNTSCQNVTANNGKNCTEQCTKCSAGSCVKRSENDNIECGQCYKCSGTASTSVAVTVYGAAATALGCTSSNSVNECRWCNNGTCTIINGIFINNILPEISVYCELNGSKYQMWPRKGASVGYAQRIWGPENENHASCWGVFNHPACNYCEGITLAGYSGWYLPTCNEYQFMMVQSSSFDVNVLIQTNYWSSQESSTAFAFYAYKYSGGSVQCFSYRKNTSNWLICTRSNRR